MFCFACIENIGSCDNVDLELASYMFLCKACMFVLLFDNFTVSQCSQGHHSAGRNSLTQQKCHHWQDFAERW